MPLIGVRTREAGEQSAMNPKFKTAIDKVLTVLVAVVLSFAADWFKPVPGPSPTPEVIPLPHSPEITGPKSPVSAGRLAKFSLPEGVSDVASHWRVVARSITVPDAEIVETDGGRTAFVETFAPCVYDVSVAGLKDAKVFHWATTFEVVGHEPQPPPVPVPPKPPTPDDGKTHPLEIVLVYESEQGVPEQFLTPELDAYTTTHCAKGYDGRPAFRCLDPQTEFTAEAEKQFKPLLDRAVGVSLPCAVVRASGVIYAQSTPDSASLMAFLRKHGGQ